MRAAPGSEAVRAVNEDRLVDGLQHLAHGLLDHLVLDGRDADGPCAARLLGNVHTPDGLVPPSHRTQPLMQTAHVGLELLPILLLRDAIHADRRLLAQAAEGALERRLIDEVRQREESDLWVSLRSLHYLQKFR